MQYIEGYYNYPLVTLSVVVSMVAAIVALDISSFAFEYSEKRDRRKWLFVAGLALGVGIWTMHLIGMFAFQLPVHVHYDFPATLASLIIITLGCPLSFFVYFEKNTLRATLTGGLIMGLAISTMHYLGMAAMHMPAKMIYEPYIVLLSILIAVGTSTLSMYIMLSPKLISLIKGLPQKLAAAMFMGLAISGMHYTGMAAVDFIPAETIILDKHQLILEGETLIIPLVIAASFLIILPLFAKDVANRKALTFALETEFLRKSETRLRLLIEFLGDAVIVINPKGFIRLFNRSASTLFGYAPEEVMGKNISMLMHGDNSKMHDSFIRRYLQTGRSSLIDTGPRKVEALHKNGNIIPVEIIISETDEGSDNQFIGIIRDISAQQAELNRLASIANYDQLTGLCNRHLFRQTLQHAISLAKRQNNMVAVMFLDLDGFKAVNDKYGHAIGDELLKKVAELLHRSTRESDTVARLGGDEFCIIIEALSDSIHSVMLSKKILQEFSKAISVEDKLLEVTSSIGIAIYPRDGDNMEQLINNADAAMYQAKKSGKNQYKFFQSI